jgi:drug/metabolite transporter (DMT)-like permease
MTQGSRSALVLAALGAVLFSAKAVVVKLCYRYGADTETVLALRMLFSLPFFWGAVWWYTVNRRPAPMLPGDRIKVLLLGFIGYYLSSYLDFLGLQYVSVGLERIILYLNPTIVLVLSAVVVKKRIDARQWLAMGVAYAGVLLVFLHDTRIDGEQTLIGSSLVFMCAITYAVCLIFAGEIVSRVGSLRLVAYASASSTFFCVLQALVRHPSGMISQVPEVYGLSLLNASVCTFVPMLLIMAAVKQVGSGLAAQAGVMGPVATVFLGWYFLGEPIGVLQALGVAIVLASMGMLWSLTRTHVAMASEAR